MAKLANKAGKSAGNVTVVDLGEEVDKHMNRRIDQKLRAAGVTGESKEKMAGPSGYKSGGYHPGTFGYRPWYADRQNKFGHTMGASMSYNERWRSLMRPNLMQAGIGGLIGVAGNVALMRVTPEFVKSDQAIVHSALAFVVGLIPVVAKPNSYTLGVALPGAVVLAMSLTDWALNSIGIKKPALRGTDGAQRTGIESSVSARTKLQQVHQSMNRPVQSAPVRVPAQAV